MKNVTAVAGQHVQIDFALYPQAITSDPVVIVSEAPAVDTTRTVVGGTIAANELNLLPLATRSPLDLIFTLPGVSEEPLSTRDLAEDRNETSATTPEEAGTFSISGGPAYSNNLTIDGLDNNDDRAARERFQPSLEAVEEVQVITNQFSAEYGRASGGRVNMRTRSGTTDLRGRIFYFFRDEALDANTFRNNARGLRRLPLQQHDLGFTLGGPVRLPRVRTKTFFFAAYEHDRVLDSTVIDTLLPVEQNVNFPLPAPTLIAARRFEKVEEPALAAEVAPFIASISTPQRNSISTLKIDTEFSPLHNGTILYQRGRLNNLRQFGGGNRLAEALQAKTRHSDAISYSDNQVLTPALLSQIRFQYSRLAPALKTRAADKPVVLISVDDPLPPTDPSHRSVTVVAGSSTTGATDRSEKRFQLQQILTYVRGAHSLKLGLDAQRIRSTFVDLSDASGTFNFASAGDFLAGVPTRFRQNFRTSSTQRNAYLGYFLQDEWRLRPNVLLSLGLRYERETIVRDVNNLGPRMSIALDPFSSGKTVLRFGAGIFYNRVLLRTVDDFTLGARQLFFDTNTLRDSVTGALLNASQRRAFIATHIQFPQTLDVASHLVKQFGVLNTGFSRRLDPVLRIPESYQANAGLERDLGGGFVFEANVTLNRGLHLWRERNINAPVLPNGYKDFSEYLASRDFANFRSRPGGLRRLYNAASAGELVRFLLSTASANSNAITRVIESGVPISVINLTSTSSTSLEVALAALNDLRPDPGKAEVEQLISAGNSFYHGLTLELRRKLTMNGSNFKFFFRAAYTLSRLVDDGVVNTSDALRPGDFNAERARSLLDRRHRFVFSGTFDAPRLLGRLRLSHVLRITSGAPFNISLGGMDRNLDDVANDRPNFNGDRELLRWREPGASIDPSLLARFSAPMIGQSGNLPRNAGHGPGQFFFDLNISREFHVRERIRITPLLELDNVLNKTTFSFGSEFINFTALSSPATPEQRQALLDSFLVATRTLRPRQLRVGLRVDF
jgi:hypothetical protein